MSIRRWTHSLSKGETNELYQELSFAIAQKISNNDVREHIIASITRNDVLTLCNFDPPYGQLTAYDAANVRQIQAFFQKRRDIDIGCDQRGNAVRKFLGTEVLCRETNNIWRRWSEGEFRFFPQVETTLSVAQSKISAMLGEVPSIETLKFRFGKGALATLPKKNADMYGKLYHRLSCSEDLVPLLGEILEEVPHLVFSPEEIQDDTCERKVVSISLDKMRLSFVRKNFETDRTIGVEPMLNSFVQLGLGDHMSKRLLKFGFDIRDQTRNQRLAREGSISGELATLDLSSASDTIATGTVLNLLPIDWFLILAKCRSSEFEFEGKSYPLEKFSSMGNGFTFPLETVLFAGLALAACDVLGVPTHNVSVYGDDIIVPVAAYDHLCEVLQAVGFIPNRKKSFSTGKFRESCGHDYLSGINIRPCYVKLGSYGPQLFVLHNFFIRSYAEDLALIVLKYIDKDVRIFGPDGFGDGHLLGDWVPRPLGRDKGYCGHTFETYVKRATKRARYLPGDFRFPTYSTYLAEEGIQAVVSSTPGIKTLADGGVIVAVPIGDDIKATTYDRIKIYTLAI